jgi:hypothetical protein
MLLLNMVLVVEAGLPLLELLVLALVEVLAVQDKHRPLVVLLLLMLVVVEVLLLLGLLLMEELAVEAMEV